MPPISSSASRIGEAARITGLTPRAIRYYEELGLLKPAVHAIRGNRRYDDTDIEQLRLIKRLREVVGLGLRELKAYLETEDVRRRLADRFHASSDSVEQIALLDQAIPALRRRVALLQAKIEAVERLRSEEQERLDRACALRRERAAARAQPRGALRRAKEKVSP